jgi:hypothetical protein
MARSSLSHLVNIAALLLPSACAGDPSGSWMSYAKFDAAGERITMMK